MLLNLKLVIESRLLNEIIFLLNFTPKIREIFFIDSVLKTNPWAYKIKDLNWEKVMGRKRIAVE